LPTKEKKESIKEIQDWMSKCTVAISTDFTNLSVSEMTGLRESLRKHGINYKVVKNTLGLLAANESGVLGFKEIISGPTGIAYGFDEPINLAKIIFKEANNKGSVLQIKGGVIDGEVYSFQDIEKLSKLPSRDQLIATLLMKLQTPIYGLVNSLDSPISSLARVIQARINQEQK
jgi:large subunit ribosomal protein L10|tara:strand:+ start:62 stop:583 length:522 start_codon:yes stop_codon:yes gene_type:complete